jgi:uncharacterized protein YbaP (TraB family)
MAAGAIAAAAPALARADDDSYPLWQVRDGDAKVFLFGDGGSATTPWRSARVERAFEESAVFWKETPDIAPGDVGKLLPRGMDHDHPLSTWLTPQQRDRVTAAALLAGTTFANLEPFQPWLAAGALNMSYGLHQKPLPDPLTVLNAAAASAGKPIRTEFPNVTSLVDWWVALSRGAQVEYLMAVIDVIEAGPNESTRRARAWTAGDLSLETRQVLNEMKTYPQAYEAETASRNRQWPARIRTMLDGGGTTFVLVGADHLVGPESVLAHLAAAHMRARRI